MNAGGPSERKLEGGGSKVTGGSRLKSKSPKNEKDRTKQRSKRHFLRVCEEIQMQELEVVGKVENLARISDENPSRRLRAIQDLRSSSSGAFESVRKSLESRDRPLTAIKRDPLPLATVSALKNIVANPPTILKSEGGGPKSFASRVDSTNRKVPEIKSSKFESVFSSNKAAKKGTLLMSSKS